MIQNTSDKKTTQNFCAATFLKGCKGFIAESIKINKPRIATNLASNLKPIKNVDPLKGLKSAL